MALFLDDVLELPALRRASPELVVRGADHPVRWVHSSEIYEIAPLLDGGEVLLTTGLGLAGATDDAIASYGESIGRRGAAALVLELGRTFQRLPDSLVDACRRCELTLVALHRVVPFAVIARTANERILDHEAVGLRRSGQVTAELTAAVLDGQTLRAIVERLAELAGTPVRLVAQDGHVVAGPPPGTDDACRVEVELFGRTWGTLHADDTGDSGLSELLERAVVAIQLSLLRTADVGARSDAHRGLVLDLAEARFSTADEVAARAAGLGVRADTPVVGLALVPDAGTTPRGIQPAVERALERGGSNGLVTALDDAVLAAADARLGGREAAQRLLATVDHELRQHDRRLRLLVVGPAAGTLADVGSSLREARRGAELARRLGDPARRVLLPGDLALLRLLVDAGDQPLAQLVDRTLAPLIEHDAGTGRPLLPTLAAYLHSGRSKAATAARLGVRRQTVHERLARIGELLDADLDDPATATTLHVAAEAWRLRIAGST